MMKQEENHFAVPNTQEDPSVDDKPKDTKKYSVKFKRSRSSRACEVCHSRKVRCDAMIHIPCTNCLTFGCECKFPEPKIRKNAKKKKVENNDISTTENSNHTTTTSSNGLEKPLLKQDPPTISHSKKKNEPVAAVSAQSAKIDQSKFSQKMSSISFIGTSSTANLLTDRANVSSSHLIKDEFVPPTLNRIMEKTRIGLDTVQMEILRVRGAFLLPEKQLCDDLVNTYFERIYPVEPLVDKEKFIKAYKEGSISILLLQSVLLAASRVSENPSLYDSDGSNYLASCTFFQRAKALYDANYERDPLTLVQSLTLFTRFWEGLDDILGNSYYWSRVAVTVAQGYGFHRTLNDTILTPEEMKKWKLAWWNLYIKDISASVSFGRPKIIHLEDCDVEMLRSEDFPEDVSYEDAESFIQLIKLSEIISIVMQEQYSAKAERFKHRENWVITHCDMLMSSWRNNLPHNLQYVPNKKFPLSVNCLNLYYYSAVCLVHRSNMVRTATLHGKTYPSEGIVFQASRIIADIAAKMMKYDQMKYCNALVVTSLFTASMTFICHMDSSNSSISKTARLGYEVLFKALNEFGKNYLIAAVIAHNMQKLASDNKARQKLLNYLAKRSIDEHRNSSATLQTNPNSFPVEPFNNDHNSGIPNQQQQQPPPPPPPQTQPIPPQENQATQDYSQSFAKYPHQRVGLHNNVQPPQPKPLTPQQQDDFELPERNNLEFPDLYLFTNTLPSSTWNNFDPAELFPSTNDSTNPSTSNARRTEHVPPSTTSSSSNNSHTTQGHHNKNNNSPMEGFNEFNANGFDPSGFNVSLPEFDFQNFNNSISLHNLASINDFFNPATNSTANNTTNSATGSDRTPDNNGNVYGF